MNATIRTLNDVAVALDVEVHTLFATAARTSKSK
jgi:hypothetical protein